MIVSYKSKRFARNIGIIAMILLVLAGGVVGKRLLGNHLLKERHASEDVAWKDWVSQCRSKVSYLSPVRDAEAKFATGDKRLIEFWMGDDALEKHVFGYSGNNDKIATRPFEFPFSLPAFPQGAPINLSGQTFCGEDRYAEDYNLTMLRLLGLRK
jgi:hypothetical protein